ncbi:DUF2834 domain-containing protein [Agromyces mangrovi Wang et al. 2018]|uniref:DUF2834 domain-containing protein n=1 Tax=Agromyces mangrovi TaxID=1858653 RepID=UPI0033063F88
MARNWTPLALVYLALSIAGLIGTWTFNALAIVQLRDFFGDWFGSGPAVSSLTVDLLVVAVAGSVLIIVEARRLGMRFAWLYVVGSALTAFAFTFPLFLAMRERRLAQRRLAAAGDAPGRTAPGDTDPGPTAPGNTAPGNTEPHG